MRKVFLDDLPICEKGMNKGRIDWVKSSELQAKVKFIYEDIQDEIQIINYDKGFLHLKYKNDIHKISTDSFKQCYFGSILRRRIKDFKIDLGTTFKDNKRDLTIIYREYKNRKNRKETEKWYKYKCNKCGWDEGWMREDHLLDGTGCSVCCSVSQTIVLGINTIWDTDRWMCDLGVSEKDAKKYSQGSGKKINVKCPDCGNEKQLPINTISTYKSIFCSCGDGKSYPEKFMYKLLKTLSIDFQTEYSPKWCKYQYKDKLRQGRYDFYFEYNNNKYVVEMDGGFHFNDNKMSGKTKEDSKAIDNIKDIIAKEQGIEIIRIDCDKSDLDYIKNNIIHSKLYKLFDLNNLSWNTIEEFALDNIVKTVCELKRNNPDMSTSDISKTVNISRNTISSYLKKGSEIWNWVEYDAKEESFKGRRKSGKASGKLVEVFKDDISLGIFESCYELEKQSEKLFGVKLNNRHISNVCNGKRKTHKGFTFKYINNTISL